MHGLRKHKREGERERERPKVRRKGRKKRNPLLSNQPKLIRTLRLVCNGFEEKTKTFFYFFFKVFSVATCALNGSALKQLLLLKRETTYVTFLSRYSPTLGS